MTILSAINLIKLSETRGGSMIWVLFLGGQKKNVEICDNTDKIRYEPKPLIE